MVNTFKIYHQAMKARMTMNTSPKLEDKVQVLEDLKIGKELEVPQKYRVERNERAKDGKVHYKNVMLESLVQLEPLGVQKS
jgi:hypothetical protein